MALSLVTAPTDSMEAVTLEEAKKQCRQEGTSDDDAFIQGVLIPAALDRAEVATQRQILTATWDLKLNGFPCGSVIELPRPNLVTVTSVSYVDASGTTQTWAASNYSVLVRSGPRARRGKVA